MTSCRHNTLSRQARKSLVDCTFRTSRSARARKEFPLERNCRSFNPNRLDLRSNLPIRVPDRLFRCNSVALPLEIKKIYRAYFPLEFAKSANSCFRVHPIPRIRFIQCSLIGCIEFSSCLRLHFVFAESFGFPFLLFIDPVFDWNWNLRFQGGFAKQSIQNINSPSLCSCVYVLYVRACECVTQL